MQIALDNIRSAKMRSVLTVLGVIIGTGTIIGVGSILAGLDGAITEAIRSFGANNMVVLKFPGGFRMRDLTPEERRRKPLSLANARAIAERCPAVQHVSPVPLSDERRTLEGALQEQRGLSTQHGRHRGRLRLERRPR